MSSGGTTANDVDVDIGQLLASLKRRWRPIVLVALLVAAVAFALAFSATPLFRADTRVLITPGESVYTRPQSAVADREAVDAESVASQVEIITSSEILGKVAEDLDLVGRDEFASASLLDRLLVMAGLTRAPSPSGLQQGVIAKMREKLEVYRVENSRVIVVLFSSEDPELAASVPNAIAAAYVSSQRAAKLEATVDATEWLEPEIAELREQVTAAEARAANFRAESGLLVGDNDTLLATQQLAELSTQLSRVRTERSAAEATAETMRAALENGAPPETLPEVLSSPLVQRLRERQVQLRAQIAELSTSLLSDHPRIRALQSQLADLNSQIRAEAMKLLQGLEAEADVARQREAELAADLERQKTVAAQAEDQQVELRALEREASAQRQLLEFYLTRYRDAAARNEASYLPVDARVFSRAMTPLEPYFPKVVPITIAAFAASLLVMGVVILLQELFSGRAMRPAGQWKEEPVAAPELPAHADSGVGEEPLPTLQELTGDEVGIEGAAEALIASGAKRALFISPEGDEAAASAVLVAREVADAGLRVLLLDLGSSGAASRPMLDSENYKGITNLLAAEAQFSEIIHADLYSACHIIPVGNGNAARAERAMDRLPLIMNSLSSVYELVIVECGAIGADRLRRLLDEETMVLMSILHREEDSVSAAASMLRQEGIDDLLLVTPADHSPTTAPPGRDAA